MAISYLDRGGAPYKVSVITPSGTIPASSTIDFQPASGVLWSVESLSLVQTNCSVWLYGDNGVISALASTAAIDLFYLALPVIVSNTGYIRFKTTDASSYPVVFHGFVVVL